VPAGASFPLGLAYLGAVALLDLVTETGSGYVGLLVLGPFFVALGESTRRTAIAAGIAVALTVVLGVVEGTIDSADHAVRTTVVITGSLVAVAFSRSRAEREDALRRIAHVAQVAQRAILRPAPPQVGSLAMAARYVSASEEALVGGDLFETAYTLHGVRLIVGDVRGKGLDAVGVAASVLSTFRERVHQADSLGDLALAIGAALRGHIGAEDFVTAVLVEIPEVGPVCVANCGHHPPLRVTSDDVASLAGIETDLPLGLGPEGLEHRFLMDPGDRLLLYTDGLVEARDRRGEEFDLVANADVLRASSLDAALDGLLDRLLSHVGRGLDDDLAVLLTERLR
jgi:serine phosphatase RsbU (regulator of sigma subunit)